MKQIYYACLLAPLCFMAGAYTEDLSSSTACGAGGTSNECQWKDDENDKKWGDLPDTERRSFWRQGITELMWERSDEEQPYVLIPKWEKLPQKFQEALEVLDWDPVSFDFTLVPKTCKLPWKELGEEQKAAASVLGYQESDWLLIAMELAEDFEPVKIQLELPELHKFNFDYLKTLTDVPVEVCDGTTIGDDMDCEFHGYTMANYVEDALKGSTLYLKYEDYDDFKKQLPSEIGNNVIKHLGGGLKASKEMREKGHWKPEWDNREFSEYNWSIWVGGTNTTTAIHYDFDEVNFLWVMHGRKRVVVIPNDERTLGKFTCPAEAVGNACWPGVDVLHTPELPEHAVEIFLGPGEGLSIPKLSWHAVQNLEPTVAFGFRINGGFWDEPWSSLSQHERESVKELGYTKASWDAMIHVGRDSQELDDDDDDDDEDDFEFVEDPEGDMEWEDLTDVQRRMYQKRGITKLMWERSEEKEPYVLAPTWDKLSEEYQQALEVLGWDAGSYDFSLVPKTSKLPWQQLNDEQKAAAGLLGYSESDWLLIAVELAEDFDPIKLQLDLPELQKFGSDYLKTLTDVDVVVCDGKTIGDDMDCRDNEYSMGTYVQEAFQGSTLYLKYEDFDDWKKQIPSEIGNSVIQYLGDGLKASKELRDNEHWLKEWDDREFSEYNWSIWIGAANTSTAIHYDFDELNFLYVMEGMKRVVVIPNDERTLGKFTCPAEAVGNGCWPGVDVLYTDELPEHAIEIFLGPGEGLSIPKLSWHAIQNMEPTVAFGFRVNGGFWDKPWSELTAAEKKSVKELGYSKYRWDFMHCVGTDALDIVEAPEEEDFEEDEHAGEDDIDDEDEDEHEKYSSVAWGDLPEKYRHSMQMIGYTQRLWEREDAYLESTLSDLLPAQKKALSLLGCAGMQSSCFTIKWGDLSGEQREAAELLGYSADEWDEIVALQLS